MSKTLVKIYTSNISRKGAHVISSHTNNQPVIFDENCIAEVSPEVALKLKAIDETISIVDGDASLDQVLADQENADKHDLKVVIATLQDQITKITAERDALKTKVAIYEEQIEAIKNSSGDLIKSEGDEGGSVANTELDSKISGLSPEAQLKAKELKDKAEAEQKKQIDELKKELRKLTPDQLKAQIKEFKPELPAAEWEKLGKDALVNYIASH